MWGEGVDDTNFVDRVFPSVTAAAERMWSWDTEPAGAGQRLGTHRCSLVRAGVPVGPIGPGAPCGKVLKSDDAGGSIRRGWTAPLLLAMAAPFGRAEEGHLEPATRIIGTMRSSSSARRLQQPPVCPGGSLQKCMAGTTNHPSLCCYQHFR